MSEIFYGVANPRLLSKLSAVKFTREDLKNVDPAALRKAIKLLEDELRSQGEDPHEDEVEEDDRILTALGLSGERLRKTKAAKTGRQQDDRALFEPGFETRSVTDSRWSGRDEGVQDGMTPERRRLARLEINCRRQLAAAQTPSNAAREIFVQLGFHGAGAWRGPCPSD
jgi:hypothetical protein